MTWYSDRSRTIDYQECPRSFWYAYKFPNGTPIPGLRPARANMDLTVGLTFHEGINHLLENHDLEESVGRALHGHGNWEGYWPLVKSQGFNLEEKEDAGYVAYEQAALAEALIRGYYYFGLPELRDRFEVVEAERDEYGVFRQGDFELVWGMRGDALLMDKNTLDLFILSLKTKKEWKGIKDEKKNRYDMQGVSETAVVEQRLRRWHETLGLVPEKRLRELSGVSGITVDNGTGLDPNEIAVPEWFITRFLAGAGPNIMGVKMDFALKGQRREDKRGSGIYKYNNPLIRPWKRDDGFKGSGYAFRFEFQDELGGNHRLGKGWNRIHIWEDIGVKSWIEMLAGEELQGLPAMTGIQDQFVFPAEYFRDEESIEEWRVSRLYEEQRIAKGVEECVPAIGTKFLKEKLREHFPKFSNYPTDCTYCQFEEVCQGGIEAYLHDPMSSGQFVPRTVNHRVETEHGNLVSIELPTHPNP